MAIPKFPEYLLPILKVLADGQEHSMQEVSAAVAHEKRLTEEEQNERMPGGQKVHYNNISFATLYLKKAGLVSSPRHAHTVITEAGKELLQTNPKTLTRKDLKKYPSFVAFRATTTGQRKKKGNAEEEDTTLADEATPTEKLDVAYRELRATLKSELLEAIMQCSPFFFEKLVVELLINLGYGGSRQEAGKAFAKSNDEGVDGVIKEDKLGLDLVYVQAKRWQPDNHVGRPEIQKFAGALQGKKTKKGVFITTSSFSKEAEQFAKNIDSKIILIDGEQLSDYMIDSNTGVTTKETYALKEIDRDYFEDE